MIVLDPPVVPVVWWNLNPECIARGYWDQGLIEDVLTNRWWSPADHCDFEHHVAGANGDQFVDPRDVLASLSRTGAVVVVPGRHNVEHVRALADWLDHLEWSLVIVTGDEEQAFPHERIMGERRKVWAQHAMPGALGVDRALGSGYPPWLRDELAQIAPTDERPVPVSFAGQITHQRRHDALRVLGDVPGAEVHPSEGFTQGLAHDQYADLLARSRAVACPSGPEHVDSFRAFEALEAGAVPIVDGASPRGHTPGWWDHVFGGPCPFPIVNDWSALPAVLRVIEDDWLHMRNVIWSWWLRYKRNLACDLVAEVHHLAGWPLQHVALPADEQITVLMVTSPIPSHPSTEVIEETLASIRAQLPAAEVLLAFDGVRPEDGPRKAAYDEFTGRVLAHCARGDAGWENVLPLVMPEWGHQANVTRWALDQVRTDLLLFVEHDTPMIGEVPWPEVVPLVRSGALNLLRFHHETTIGDYHMHLMLDSRGGIRFDQSPSVPIVRTVQWSQRPHLASTRFYRERVLPLFPPEARTMIEDKMHSVVAHAYHDHGEPGWWDWRLGMYAPTGNMQRSIHLDGRAGAEKYDMQFGGDQ